VNHYLLLTLYGVGLASLRGAWDWFDALRRVSLAAGACCSVAACSRSRRASSRTNSPAGALFANMFTWVWLAVFLAYGHRHLSHTNRWLAWSREARYPIYILHQTVIIGLAY
jgi:glucans biosynthesis protein C